MENRAKTYNVSCTVSAQEYTLYTCPDNCRAKMNLLYLTNSDGTTTVNVEWNRADGSHVHILGGKNMTSGEFIQWSGAYIVLEPTETFTVSATVGSGSPHIDILCTVEEYFLPNRTY
jgi:hypothetical protein